MFIVYKYTSPSKRNYIGVTKYPEVRRKQHASKEWNLDDDTKFAKAIRKYGFENLKYEVIDQAETLEEVCQKEIHWIKFYDSISSGYNISTGGDWNASFKHDEKVIDDVIYLLKHTSKKLREIAEQTGLSIAFISDIKNGFKRNNKKIHRPPQLLKGSEQPNSKLDEDTVKEIKNKLASGVSRRSIQVEYKISKTLVQLIATEQIWSHVKCEYIYNKKETNGNAKLTVDVVKRIKDDIKNKNGPVEEIANKYNISVATYYQIKSGKTWKDI